MAVINAGWLTDFQDIKFAPKTLFSQVYVDNPTTGKITDLNSYFTTLSQKYDTSLATINNLNLRVTLGSDSSVQLKSVNNNIGVDGILPVKHGGTGLDTLPQYDLMYGDGTNAVKFITHDTSDTDGVKFLVNNPSAAPSYKTLGVNYTAGKDVGATYNIQIGGKDTGANFSLPIATTTQSGVVIVGEQSFSGNKTFTSNIAVTGATTLTGLLTTQSGIDVYNKEIKNVAGMTYTDADRFYFIDDDGNAVAYVDSAGVSAINFISKNSDGTVKYDMNVEFAALDNRIDTNYATLDAAIKQEAADRASAVSAEATTRENADNNIYAILGETTLSTSHKKSLETIFDILGEETLDTTNGSHRSQLEDLRTTITDMKGSTFYIDLSTESTSVKFSDAANSATGFGISGILKIDNGGTGTSFSSLVQGGIIYAHSTSAFGCSAAGSTGQFLISQNTATPKWITPSISLVGDIAGTGNFDNAGTLTLNTTISNSGVTEGTYGPSSGGTVSSQGTFSVPYITVGLDGRITEAVTNTFTMPNVYQLTQYATTADSDYPILCKYSISTTSATSYARFASGVTINPSTGTISASAFNASGSMSATYMNAWAIELSPSSSMSHGGYIDFHYAGSTEDYTTRLWENASGQLEVVGATQFSGKVKLNSTALYGTKLPDSGEEGQIFFLLLEEE